MSGVDRFDFAVIGGGIVGLATARALLMRCPGATLIVLEAEARLAQHQSGRNSGVIHAGLYYAPGSSKAALCCDGRERMYRYCAEKGVAHRRCGKVVAAMEERELPALAELERRANANGLADARRLDAAGVRALEPAASAIAGLHIPQTGVVDFAAVALALADDVKAMGGEVRASARVVSGAEDSTGVRLSTKGGEILAGAVVNCAGLHCDRVARGLGCEPGVRIVPFRGEYWSVSGASAAMVRGLIYPVPDARYPFLGVHLTRGVDGRVHAGPNAVLALARRGYRWRDVSLSDVWEMAAWPGARRFVAANMATGLAEARRSLSRRRFARAVQRLAPAIAAADLARCGSGVRAQAIDRQGRLVTDFLIERTQRCAHVLNAPSPAATASLAIGERIAAMVCEMGGRSSGVVKPATAANAEAVA